MVMVMLDAAGVVRKEESGDTFTRYIANARYVAEVTATQCAAEEAPTVPVSARAARAAERAARKKPAARSPTCPALAARRLGPRTRSHDATVSPPFRAEAAARASGADNVARLNEVLARDARMPTAVIVALSQECTATYIAAPSAQHVDRKGRHAQGGGHQPFVEALCRVSLPPRGAGAGALAKRRKSAGGRAHARHEIQSVVGKNEGSLFFPGLFWLLAYAPDADLVLVNLYHEDHAVVGAGTYYERARYGVGGSRENAIVTVADW